MTADSKTRIAVGMSGGIDSSAVASLCVDLGYEVIGLTLHMFKEGSRCCSIEDVNRARRICDQLGMKHYTINAIEMFEEAIVQPFVDEYARGRTPSPCILCNEHIKFGFLHTRALQLGCTKIATGHYARIEQRDGTYRLLRPADESKDQTYFLHRLNQDQLSRSLFPLDGYTKADAIKHLAERDIVVKRVGQVESQDLCFVPDEGHPLFVQSRRPELKKTGDIVNDDGKVLGHHEGFFRFTRGQRRGLAVAAGKPIYVKELHPDENRVVIGYRNDIMSDTCVAERVHWIAERPKTAAFRCKARVRYRQKESDVSVEILDDDQIRITFDVPQFAITPGQAAVLYNEDEILGGGWIATG